MPGPAPLSSAHVVSLGCAKNAIDSERLQALLTACGLELSPDPAGADVVIVNTCSFIDPAKAESVEVILAAARLKESGRCRRLVVAGCLVESDLRELEAELPEVDAFIGLDQFDRLPALLGLQARSVPGGGTCPAGRLELPRLVAGRPWAYLQLSDGCDHACTYCAIPGIRGPLRSRPLERIVGEAELLVAGGARELCLVAQDVTSYGHDSSEAASLGDVARGLCALEGVAWVRLLYVHPKGVDEAFLDVFENEPSLCGYLDIPIQHVADHILGRMGRGYSQGDLVALLDRLGALRKAPALRTSVMVGFPGETDDDVDELAGLLREGRFRQVAVFEYSPQPRTAAADFPGQVPEEVRRERRHQIELVVDEKSELLAAGDVGRYATVLVESVGAGSLQGRTEWQAPEIDGSISVSGCAGRASFVQVKVTASDGLDLEGEIVDAG